MNNFDHLYDFFGTFLVYYFFIHYFQSIQNCISHNVQYMTLWRMVQRVKFRKKDKKCSKMFILNNSLPKTSITQIH